MPKLSSRREYFRLPYPITTGAVLTVNGTSYKVDELSEHGLRVITGVGRLAAETPIEGTLTLVMGTQCVVKGMVLRVDDDAFIVRIDKGIKGYDVIREQVFVSKQFPDWKPQPA
jgi:PilZ domain-containing protein